MKTYTLNEIKTDNFLVVFIENKEQWNKIYEAVGRGYMTSEYRGAHCYKLYNGTYTSTSSKTFSGTYGKVTIIQFNQISDFIEKEEEERKEEKREIIGYILKEEYKQYEKAVLLIGGLYTFSKKTKNFDISYGENSINLLKQAEVLDVWFEPVYKSTFPNITINDYKGEFFDGYVKFGCAKISKYLFALLNDAINRPFPEEWHKSITSVTIGKGTFTAEEIKEIAEYYNKK